MDTSHQVDSPWFLLEAVRLSPPPSTGRCVGAFRPSPSHPSRLIPSLSSLPSRGALQGPLLQQAHRQSALMAGGADWTDVSVSHQIGTVDQEGFRGLRRVTLLGLVLL